MHTEATASNNPAARPRAFSVVWLSRLRAARGYDVAVRVLGCSWFLLLALTVAAGAFAHAKSMSITGFSPTGWSALLSTACMFLFYLGLCWMMLHRPSPAARTDGVLPSLIAFVGTYLPWTVVLFAPTAASTGQKLASAVLLLIGTVLMVVVILHLGRSFSIVPQARSLVRSGPYAVVRNPLYFVEEVALFGILLQVYSPMTLELFLAHGVLQLRRIFYEENLLRRTFPDYDDYARSTPRLIPYVW
jgi:protein-S-isoprenylcysteine O-methyltransferase Ste14